MKKIQLTKDNYKKFSLSALFPNRGNKVPSSTQGQAILRRNLELLQSCENDYSSLQNYRDRRQECVNYFFGDQLSRMIPDPKGCGTISIENYCIQQGMTPLVLNLITSRIRQMVGSYEKQKLEDLVVARDRDEQKLGEMMSVAMQYAYQQGDFYRGNADGYREFLLGGLPAFRTGYDWNAERKVSEVYADLSDTNLMFWDNNTSGRYFENISRIGELHEFTLLQILAKFAKSPAMRNAIIQAYDEVRIEHATDQQFTRDSETNRRVSFYNPRDPYKYRVIEVWSKEEHEVYECTDLLDSDTSYVIDCNQIGEVIAENESRRKQIASFGGDPNDATLIEYQYRVDTDWVVRFLTPSGHILYEANSPYTHGGHPWAIGGYPMVDGRVQSLVHDLIPAQDMVNRVIMRSEFTQMNKAKGFGIVSEEALEASDMTLGEFAAQYTSPKGIVKMRTEQFGGVDKVFKRFSDDGSNGNYDMQMLQTYIELINQQSGSTEASRGERGHSGEPASRYMMETENSNNNTADGEMWFNGLIMRRDYKLMTLIQQYWEGVKYINLAGKDYSEESKVFNSDRIRNTLLDLSIIQSPSSGAVRFMMEDTLKTLFENQAIDANTWLESTSMHGADKVLERKKAHDKEREQQQAQAAQAQQAAQMQAQAAQPIQQPQNVM